MLLFLIGEFSIILLTSETTFGQPLSNGTAPNANATVANATAANATAANATVALPLMLPLLMLPLLTKEPNPPPTI